MTAPPAGAPAGAPAGMPVRWRLRAEPLPAAGLLATGPAALALADQLIARWERLPAGRVAGWRGAGIGAGAAGAAGCWIGLIGADLPYGEGVIWLGRDPEAPGLLLPTLLGPETHPALIEGRLLQGAPAPLIVVPQQGAQGARALGMAAARPLSRERLAAWRGR